MEIIALSSYATHKDYTIEEWLKVQEAVKNDKKLQESLKWRE